MRGVRYAGRECGEMKCPDEIRVCPHQWIECEFCANLKLCILGLYIPEPESDLDVVIKAAKIAEQVVDAGVRESVEKIRGTWMEEFNNLQEGEIWEWMAKYKMPGDINFKESLPAGPSEPGGGSKGRNHKKPAKKMPEYMKILGM